MSFEDLLNKTAVVKGRTVTASHGSDTVSYATTVASYGCRLYSVRPQLVKKTTGEEVEVKMRAIGGVNVLIVEGSLLLVDGLTYEIVGVYTVTGESEDHHMQLDLMRRYDI